MHAVIAQLAWRGAAADFTQVLPHDCRRVAGTARAAARARRLDQRQPGRAGAVNGTDLLIIGAARSGSDRSVRVHGQLVTLLASQPQLFMQTAIPALSEFRTSAPQARVFQVSTA